MKKGVTLPEVSISLLIITIALIIFFNIANNLLYNLTIAKKMFLIVNANQKALELFIAWRNKNLEAGEPQPWFSSVTEGNYCITFSTTTKDIILVSTNDFCPLNYTQREPEILILNKIEVNKTGDIAYITSTSKTKEGLLPEHHLNLILTNWHPYFAH